MPHVQIDARSSARATALAPNLWLWLGPNILIAWLVVMLALCFGIFAFVAVREIAIECRYESGYATTADGEPVKLADGVSRAELAQKQPECRE